jgi:non-ribosomal peptide synthetase component E (peptide arylation enzyme)
MGALTVPEAVVPTWKQLASIEALPATPFGKVKKQQLIELL